MKCRRPNCSNIAMHQGRNQGLCDKHYRVCDTRGYVDAAPVRAHLKRLNQAGYSWRHLAELTGKSEQGMYLIRDVNQRVQLETARAVLSIPAPALFSGEGYVDATGIHRRIRALQALGWTQRDLERRLGIPYRHLSVVLRHQRIYTRKARAIADLYEELSGTPGPSERTRVMARNRGWAPPLAWENIDDPSESPDLGESRRVFFDEKYWELSEVLGLSDPEIASVLGIDLESLQRNLQRELQKKQRNGLVGAA